VLSATDWPAAFLTSQVPTQKSSERAGEFAQLVETGGDCSPPTVATVRVRQQVRITNFMSRTIVVFGVDFNGLQLNSV
jgi:hypothetical protein